MSRLEIFKEFGILAKKIKRNPMTLEQYDRYLEKLEESRVYTARNLVDNPKHDKWIGR